MQKIPAEIFLVYERILPEERMRAKGRKIVVENNSAIPVIMQPVISSMNRFQQSNQLQKFKKVANVFLKVEFHLKPSSHFT